MPRIQTLICSVICFVICSVTTAQSLHKNPTIQQVVSYHVYQQKKWNYDQLPKKSIQYRSDPKYIQLTDRKVLSTKLNISTVKIPEVKKSFSGSYILLHNNSKSYLQNSRFLKYQCRSQKLIEAHQMDLSCCYTM